MDFIGGGCLVGHNVKFDLDFLCYEMSLIGRRLHDVTPAVDTVKLAKRFLPQLSSYQLSSLAQYFGIVVKETHRALKDVELTTTVMNHLLNLAESQGVGAFDDFLKEFSVVKPNFKIQQPAAQALLF